MANALGAGQFAAILAYVSSRRTGSDVRLLVLLDLLSDETRRDRLSVDQLAEAERCVLDFKYWLDEPGVDSMCYWSESHYLIFSVCAYLAGGMFPDRVFTNSGRTGAEQRQLGESRIRSWLDLRFRLGMFEWLSAATYVEVIATLKALITWGERELARRAAMVLDLVLLDVAMHSFEGDFGPPAARATPDARIGTAVALVAGHDQGTVTDPVARIIARPGGYEVPPVLREIIYDEETRSIHSTFGLDPRDIVREVDPTVAAADACLLSWQTGAFTASETVKYSMRGYRHWKLAGNRSLAELKRAARPALLNRHHSGRQLLRRARVVNFRTRHYQLASVQGYRVGEIATAQPWQALLPSGIRVTGLQPAAATGTTDSGFMPAVGQFEHILLALYDTHRTRGLRAESKVLLPLADCDDARLGRTWVAAQSRGSFIGLLSVAPMELVARDQVLQRGPVTGWAVIMGDRSQSTSLNVFANLLKASRLALDGGRLHLRLTEYGRFVLDAEGDLRGPRGRISHPVGRWRNPWVKPFSPPGEVEVTAGTHRLHLDWQAGGREFA